MAERWGIGLMAAIGAAAGGLSAAAASLLDGGDALPAGLAVGVAGGAVVSAALAWAVREQRDLPGLSTPSPLPVALPQPAPALETGPPANLEPLVRAIGERFSALADRQLEAIQQLGDTRPDLRGSAPLAEADRLARRSARAATTLLVLADPDELAPPGRDRTIAEVLDAALADSAHRDRIDVGSLHDETVRGLFVGDVAHLLAELIDNAAAASVEPVVVVGRRAADGYVLAVVDEGAGLSAVARAGANEVLHSPPELHSQEPVALGLSVVGRLAARHGISVQLLEGATDGTIAKVRLPARLLEGGEQQQQPSALDRAMEALAPAPSSLPEGDHVDDPTSPMSLFDGAHDDTADLVIDLTDRPVEVEATEAADPDGADPWPVALAEALADHESVESVESGEGPGGADEREPLADGEHEAPLRRSSLGRNGGARTRR